MPRRERRTFKATAHLVPPPGLEDFVTCRVCEEEFKSLSWKHLDQHGLTGDQYKKEFGEDFVCSPLLRWQIAASKRVKESRKRILPRSREAMIQDLRKHAKQRGGPVTLSWLKAHDPNLIEQSSRLFCGWLAFLKAAGLQGSNREKWPPRRVLEGIRGRVEKGLPFARG